MKQEYVLPKFRIPGQPNWLVRGVWFLAGVVTLSLGALGLAYWRRSSVPPAPAVAVAPAPVAPAAATPPAKLPVPAPAKPAPAPGATPAGAPAGKLAAGKRLPGRYGSRGLRTRGWGKGKAGAGARARGGKRGLAARRAYLKKKRLLAARRANAGWPAKPTAGASSRVSPQRAPAPTPATTATRKSKGDPIDDILRNFK